MSKLSWLKYLIGGTVLVLLIILTFRDHTFANEKTALQAEISAWNKKNGIEAASLAYILASPYMSCENRGRFDERILTIFAYYQKSPEGNSPPRGGYFTVLQDLSSEIFDVWAANKLLNERGNPNSRHDREVLLGTTPQSFIKDMYVILEDVHLLQHPFPNADFSREKLEQTRQDFSELSALFDGVLARARDEASARAEAARKAEASVLTGAEAVKAVKAINAMIAPSVAKPE
ncbi:MAG: hypothetical protein WC285_03975 [Candidatus Gracilibacteria bacterium]|jgi:hypothetical protein